MEQIQLQRVKVLADRVVFYVRIPDPALRRTNPDLARRALQLRPSLASHACVNSVGNTFASVIDSTPLPHLLEHCTIDFLVESSRFETQHVGTSAWIDGGVDGRARIELSMRSDLEVLRAFKRACGFLEDLLAGA